MDGYNHDLLFIPAYLLACCSAYYSLAKHPAILTKVLAITTSLVGYYNLSCEITTLDLLRVPDLVIIPICLVWAVSISSIVRCLDFDRVYSLFMLSGLSCTIGLAWTFGLPADLVGLGLLPLSIITSLALTRLAQSVGNRKKSGRGREVFAWKDLSVQI